MLGYMNREALQPTLARRRVVFFSRGRQQLWEKGETSGHSLDLEGVAPDCDGDTLLVTARPRGPVCHRGAASCFGAVPRAAPGRIDFLATLEEVIAERGAARPAGSYTAALLASGCKRVAQKVGEEGLEVALAAAGRSDAVRLTDATQRGLCDRAGFKIGADETGRVSAFGFDHARVQRVDANLARAELT